MSEHLQANLNAKNNMTFALIIAITALILSLTSGVVNYRQNNLSNLESSLRDTRDQLQLAKNDITDIRMKTLQQLVDAQLALQGQGQLKQENAQLTDQLKESSIRTGALEAQIRRMDAKISSQLSALRAARKKSKTQGSKKKLAASKHQKVASGKSELASNGAANVDVYVDKMGPSQQYSIITAIKNQGFKPKSLKLLDSMSLSDHTTVYYYDAGYKEIANNLVRILKANGNSQVSLRKGVSPYAKNKIIVHVIGQ